MLDQRKGCWRKGAIPAMDERDFAINVLKIIDVQSHQSPRSNIIRQNARRSKPDAVSADNKVAQDVTVIANEAAGCRGQRSNAGTCCARLRIEPQHVCPDARFGREWMASANDEGQFERTNQRKFKVGNFSDGPAIAENQFDPVVEQFLHQMVGRSNRGAQAD